VVREALEFSFALAAQGSPIEGARLVVEDVPLTVYCRDCDGERAPAHPFVLSCPDCGSPTPSVVRGKELELRALEVA
jgi:hydrogenase nickel incorporation protein HypA/HybF